MSAERPLVLRGPPGFGEAVAGEALVSSEGFSARYDLDHTTGVISREAHELYGQSLVGKVLVVSTAKGGTATGWRLLDLVARGTAPAALVFRRTNPVMVQGAVMAGIPIMHRLDPDPIDTIATGDRVRLAPAEGLIEVERMHAAASTGEGGGALMERSTPAGTSGSAEISEQELALATRNHGMPLEALRHEITPIGLHYLLIHYDIPVVDPADWRLRIDGLVERPLTLSLEQLRARPRLTAAVTMECAGNGRASLSPRPLSQPWLLEAVGTAEWTGTPLAPLIEECGLAPEAVELVFTGIDRGVEGGVEQSYQRSLPLAEALADGVLLAYEANGQPLPPQHGYPLRLVVPGWYGMTSVKWLRSISAVAEPFEGYQQAQGYRMMRSAGDPGTPVTRMMPRSLMAPPGIPDFMSRRRFLKPGPVRLEGRAWSGWGAIELVDVSVDGGETWVAAELGAQRFAAAWRGWTCTWEPPGPGDYELCSRAVDSAGNVQPVAAEWNLKGYANNSLQRVPVTVG